MGGHDANEAQVEAALSHAPPAYELEAPIDQDAPPQYAETTGMFIRRSSFISI
jgi:hypothetical protein